MCAFYISPAFFLAHHRSTSLDIDIGTQVYECVLRACVEVSDGRTALEVLRRQAAEPKQLLLQNAPPSDAVAAEQGGQREVSGGPPDRRCWSLAAEALGRAGMVKEVRHVVHVHAISAAATLVLFVSGRRAFGFCRYNGLQVLV